MKQKSLKCMYVYMEILPTVHVHTFHNILEEWKNAGEWTEKANIFFFEKKKEKKKA